MSVASEDTLVTEASDYDPFQAKAGNKAAQPEDDSEDEGIVETLFDILKSRESVPQEFPPVSAAPPAAPTAPPAPRPAAPRRQAPAPAPEAAQPSPAQRAPARPAPTAHEEHPRPQRPPTTYDYNPATGRWEPVRAPPPEAAAPKPATQRDTGPGGLGSGCAGGGSGIGELRPDGLEEEREPPVVRQGPRNFIIAECEATARADASGGDVSYPQALAVRLALRFETRPEDMLKTMAEAGLPSAKDQRSTVKAVMRLCHPDKCAHPEAKRAMQVLVKLLTSSAS